jgi:hypothetical protein
MEEPTFLSKGEERRPNSDRSVNKACPFRRSKRSIVSHSSVASALNRSRGLPSIPRKSDRDHEDFKKKTTASVRPQDRLHQNRGDVSVSGEGKTDSQLIQVRQKGRRKMRSLVTEGVKAVLRWPCVGVAEIDAILRRPISG